MIKDDRSCADLAQQQHAVENAISAAKKALIHDHRNHCLGDAVRSRGSKSAALVQLNQCVPDCWRRPRREGSCRSEEACALSNGRAGAPRDLQQRPASVAATAQARRRHLPGCVHQRARRRLMRRTQPSVANAAHRPLLQPAWRVRLPKALQPNRGERASCAIAGRGRIGVRAGEGLKAHTCASELRMVQGGEPRERSM